MLTKSGSLAGYFVVKHEDLFVQFKLERERKRKRERERESERERGRGGVGG